MDEGLISNKLRSVISLVDKLRDINLQSYIKLPKIAAVGSQSSGKSSLIEQIVGLDFLPRGSGVVTRRPLQIRMVYEKELKHPYAKFVEIPQKMTNFTKVKQSIQKLTDKVCGTQKNIIDKPIILDIYSANCPNLTIIDLPGLTRIPIDGQDKNIFQITSNIIKKYMQQPSTIILCVISANEDITNDQVLFMARSIDKLGERTIGCITKIDIMDRGTDARSLLLNQGEVPLKLGYIGIKNRSQEDINKKMTVQQSLQVQKMFFSKSPIYSSLPTDVLGSTSLANKLTKVLTQSIWKFLPDLISKIKQRKQQLSQIVKSYGRPLPKSQQQKASYVWQICSQFVKQYKKCLVGQISVLKCKQHLLRTSSNMRNQLYTCLQQQYNNKINQLLEDSKVQFAIYKFEGNNLPGFPSISAFLYLLHPLLREMKLPMIQNTLDHIFDELSHIVDLITSQIAFQYSLLKQHLDDKINGILNKYRKNSRQFIQNIMQVEFNYIYTNNPTFLINSQSTNDVKKQKQNQQQSKTTKNPMIKILKKKIQGYYKVVVRNLRDIIPKNIQYSLFIQATKQIQFQIFQVANQKKIDQFLQINEFKKNQRMKNQQQYAILCKAQQYILTQSGLSGFKQLSNKGKIQKRQQQLNQINKRRQQKQKQKQKEKQKEKQKQKQKQKQKGKQKVQQKVQQKEKQKQKNPQKTQPKTTNNTPTSSSSNLNQLQQQKSKNELNDKKINNNNINTNDAQKKKNFFTNFFGSQQTKKQQNKTQQNKNKNKQDNPPKPKNINQSSNAPQKKTLTQSYNHQVGKATDKAVDAVFADEKFKQQSKQAVSDGTAIAVQNKLGLSQQNSKTIGKGAGFIFGSDMAQNLLKAQAKKGIRQQTQLPSK